MSQSSAVVRQVQCIVSEPVTAAAIEHSQVHCIHQYGSIVTQQDLISWPGGHELQGSTLWVVIKLQGVYPLGCHKAPGVYPLGCHVAPGGLPLGLSCSSRGSTLGLVM